jgi:WD repeat-containing protein 68
MQMNNMNQMIVPEMQMTQEQINEQLMIQYQNQMNQMANNNQDIPMNYYMANIPQVQSQLTPEQIQYQKQSDLNENKNIYDYTTNMKLYGIAFQKGNCPRLAISSLEKRLDNKIEILELVDNELKNVYEQMVGYPCTKLLWSPNENKSSLLAFSSDCIQIYDYSEEKQVLSFQARLNNLKSQYCGPLTSFDWNTVNDSLLGTASIDNTCTIWDLNKQTIKTQLIAHDKEVFDIQFGNDENTFISGGADGTVRLFDLRNLDHSTIIHENEGCINKLAMNLQVPNYIVALCLDKNAIYIFDSRMNSNVVMDEINLHKEPVTGCIWAPDNPAQLCSVSEDCNVIISNIGNELAQNNNVSYTAPAPINNVDWCKNFPEWIGITFQDRVQLLRK